MEQDDEEKESLFRRFEAWSIDLDLHIWYGAISVIALIVLLFIVEKEFNKTAYLTNQVLILKEESRVLMNRNQDLMNDLEKQRQLYLLSPTPSKPEVESVEKAANKVNEKINKVQNALIDKATQSKVITKTETTLVPTPTAVNKELNTMMFQSYCATVPESPKCKEVKK